MWVHSSYSVWLLSHTRGLLIPGSRQPHGVQTVCLPKSPVQALHAAGTHIGLHAGVVFYECRHLFKERWQVVRMAVPQSQHGCLLVHLSTRPATLTEYQGARHSHTRMCRGQTLACCL